MNRLFENLSMRWKVVSVVMVISALVLMTSSLVMVASDLVTMQRNLEEHVTALARVASINSSGALAFRDPETASEVLSAMSSEPEVIGIQIRTLDGQVFSQYGSSNPLHLQLLEEIEKSEAMEWHDPSSHASYTAVFHPDYLDRDMAIEVNGKPIGYMDMQYSTSALKKRMFDQLLLSLLVFVGGMILAFLLAIRLHRVISGPISNMANAMEATARKQDFTVRLSSSSGDEINTLVQAFNRMLEQIEIRDSDLRKAKDAAEAGSQAKSQFLAAMSHEIRTPMNGIIGMTELLRNTHLNSRQKHFTDTIQNSADTLLNILNDILDFSKIEAGRLELETVDLDLRQIVERTTELLAENAHTKGLSLTALIDPELPSHYRGDPGRLQQILTNLLSNAIKFTERGSIQVAVSRVEEDEHGDTIYLEVQDTGIGLSEEERERIFDHFTQADTSTTRKYGGTGLGLTITRQLVELMGGSIEVQSSPGRGSVFRIILPMLLQDRLSSSSDKGFPRFKVLIVDQDEATRQGLSQQLTAWGMETICIADLNAALPLARGELDRGEPFDIVLLELAQLPEDHVAATDGLKDVLSQSTDVILLGRIGVETSSPPGWEQTCFITKPVIQPSLRSCIQDIVNDLTKPVAQTSGIIQKPQLGLNILVAEDNPVNQEVAVSMLEVLGCKSTICPNGQAVLDTLQESEFDLVLMDCEMPEMDGYEATRRIRQNEQQHDLPHLPVIALTAHAMERDRNQALASGMDDYLSKPFKLDELIDILLPWTDMKSVHAAQQGSKAF